jgi:Zn-dependent oligopeptidase
MLDSEDAIFKVVAATYERYGAFPVSEDTSIHLTFWHLALASYASQYYSYLFAEVICHDLFQEFQKGGNIMDIDVATRYRKVVLEKVGSHDADEVVATFLGRKYNAVAFKDWLNELV